MTGPHAVRVEGLEGMRGIAAFIVFVHHFLLVFYPSFHFSEHSWKNMILNPDLAVSWFFAHSGFVLAWKSRNMTASEFPRHIMDLALRRYLRLLPLVLVSIILTFLALSLGLIHSPEYSKLVGSSWLGRYLNFSGNFGDALLQSLWGVFFNFKSSTSFNPSLWTIGYELISSYLLFFALFIFRTGTKSLVGLSLIALITGSWKGVLPFFLGAALTRIPLHKPPRWLLIALALIAIPLGDLTGKNADFLRGLSASVLMYVLIHSTSFRKHLAKGIPDFLGRISYSLYAIHFLILASFTSWLGLEYSSHESVEKIAINFFLTTLILVCASQILHRLVDRPGIRFSKWFSNRILRRTQGPGGGLILSQEV
jgi:peptidoglycan/LPS O-acetylase OafA/YrhL